MFKYYCSLFLFYFKVWNFYPFASMTRYIDKLSYLHYVLILDAWMVENANQYRLAGLSCLFKRKVQSLLQTYDLRIRLSFHLTLRLLETGNVDRSWFFLPTLNDTWCKSKMCCLVPLCNTVLHSNYFSMCLCVLYDRNHV